MGVRRIFGHGAAFAALWLLIAQPAFADGLSQFEKLIKPQLPPGSLTYKSAKTLGNNGFVLEDVVLTPPPGSGGNPEPIAIKRISVEDLDFSAFEKHTPPNFVKMRIEGIVIAGKPAEGVDLNQLAGIDKLTADFLLDYRLEPERKTMSLNKLELDVKGLGRIELSMILDGVSPDAAGNPEAAMNDASLRTATFVFEDRSILAKVVPAVAKLQGSNPAATIAMAKAMLTSAGEGQGPLTEAVLAALGSFLDDYAHPKGPLRITLNPPSKISAAALSAATGSEEVIKALGLVVSY
jgi:hypothetical protein